MQETLEWFSWINFEVNDLLQNLFYLQMKTKAQI